MSHDAIGGPWARSLATEMMISLLGIIVALTVLPSCSDESAAGGGAAGGGAAGGAGGTATGTTGGGGSGASGTGGSVACTTPLAERLRVTTTGLGPVTSALIAPLPSGGAKVVWQDQSGTQLDTLDSADQPVGSATTLASLNVDDLVAHEQGAALLVKRDDAFDLVRVDESGATSFQEVLVGDNSHQNEGDRWAGGSGRLAWSSDGYGAYYMVSGNWGSQGVHQGDQLKYLDPAGAVSGGGWDWGCSHSLDLRIVHNGTRFGPVCLSDCYPGKGIYYNHNGALLSDEPSGNCGGYSAARLGGVAPAPGGFWVSWTTPEGRSSSDVALAFVSDDGEVDPTLWLTDTDGTEEQSPKLTSYGDGMLAGWSAGSGEVDTLVALDSTGTVVEGPVPVDAPSPAGGRQFMTFANGDAGWLAIDGQDVVVVRVQACR